MTHHLLVYNGAIATDDHIGGEYTLVHTNRYQWDIVLSVQNCDHDLLNSDDW